MTIEDLRALYYGVEMNGKHIKGALEDDPDFAVVLALAAVTGCRRGELCGLEVEERRRLGSAEHHCRASTRLR